MTRYSRECAFSLGIALRLKHQDGACSILVMVGLTLRHALHRVTRRGGMGGIVRRVDAQSFRSLMVAHNLILCQ